MPIPKPHKGEQEHDYVARAHRALFEEYKDADRRNAIIFKTWREHHGESEAEKVAHSKFPDDEFERIENVPHFKEHEYPWMPRNKDGTPKLDGDGNPEIRKEVYDFDSLRAICDNMNERIVDTLDFSPLSDKHNPRKGSDESKPKLVGFAGPFGLGMVGNKNPKWAIIAKEEHWFKDKADMARDYPRRSPEVYLGRPMEKRILDPVTVLGVDTPALDMGIHYAESASPPDVPEELNAYYSGPAIMSQYGFDESKHKRDEVGKFAKKAHEATSEAHDHSRVISYPTKFEKFHTHAHEAMRASQDKDHHKAMVLHEMAAKSHQSFSAHPEHGEAHHQAKRAHERAARAHEEADLHSYDSPPKEHDALYSEPSQNAHGEAAEQLLAGRVKKPAAPKAEYDAGAAGACMPGGGNTFIAGDDSHGKKKGYSEETEVAGSNPSGGPQAEPAERPEPEGKQSMISPEDANTIIQALMETGPMKWVLQKMESEQGPEAMGKGHPEMQEPPNPAAGKAEPAAVGAPQPPKEQLTEETAPGVREGESEENHEMPVAHDNESGDRSVPEPKDKEEKPPMSVTQKKDTPENEENKKAGYAEREEARAETAKYAALEQKVALLEAKNADAEKAAAASKRQSDVRSLRLLGYDIDVDDEIQRCSLENMPTEREFQNHLDTLAKYSQRIPLGVQLFTPDQPLIDDKIAAATRKAARTGSKDGAPSFMDDEGFRDEVAAYAYELQCQPDYDPTQGSVFDKAVRHCTEKRVAAKSGAPAKVG